MARHKAPTTRLRRLAYELRQLRSNADLTSQQVAEATGLVPSTLFRLESAKVKPQARTLRTLLDLYGVTDDQRQELEALLKAASDQTWLQPASEHLPGPYAAYIGFEHEAESLLNYESSFMPGLVQTEDYARAVIIGSSPQVPEGEVENRVSARLERQTRLTRDQPLVLNAVIDEAVLRRIVGGRAVMRAQIQKLRDSIQQPNITLQLIPNESGSHPGMYGAFAILRFSEAQDVVYMESSANDLFLESPEDVKRFNLMFEHLQAVAASPEATDTFLATVLDET
ncbi:helix-turn-helix domain-containing protein [Nonomuraea sp. NPDC002799]